MRPSSMRLTKGRCNTTFLLTLFFVFLFSSCMAQPVSRSSRLEGQWLINFRLQDIGLARTVMEFNTDKNTFSAHTRKDADRDILGNWTSLLGRTFTKGLKNGSLIRIEQGIFKEKSDTLFLAGILVTPMGNYNIDGNIVKGKMNAIISNTLRPHIGSAEGIRDIPQLPLEDYQALFKKCLSLTAQNIYDKRELNTKEWKAFVADMTAITPKLQDDLEMVFAFFYKAGKLPFSHYSLLKLPADNESDDQSPAGKNLFLQEESKETACLKITSFGGGAAEVDSVFDIISGKGYKNLVVDLRNNTGGSVEAGMAFAKNVLDTTIYGGVFLTQKWFNKNKGLPSMEDYKAFPIFSEANFNLIMEGIHNTEGLCLKIVPRPTVYKGKLYLLTNSRTASTCEPIVYELKRRKRAIIVGTKTAGAMLNGEIFELDKGFKMVIPTADYYAADGYRLDGNGVTPDMETDAEKALDAALEMSGN